MTGFRNLMTGAAGAASGGYEVDNGMVLNDNDSQYLSFLPSQAPTSDRICTFSFWVKRGSISNQQKIITQGQESGGVAESIHIYFLTDDRFEVLCENTSGGVNIKRRTTQVFRDPHAWYHFCIRIDGSQTDDTSCTIEVNGATVTAFDPKTNPSSSTDLATFNNVKALNIGRLERSPSGSYGDYYLSEFVGIDGTALAASNFGEYDTNGVWRPIDVTGLTFGNNGFYLPFTNSAGLGQDYSGSTSTTVVQQNTYNAGSEINDGDGGANPSTGMLFIPPATGTVSKIELNASARGFSGVTVRLETDSGSGQAPSGTLVTNGEVTGITSSGAGLKTATFSTPPEVTAGVKYWIVLRGDTGTWGWQHDVAGVGPALGLYQGGQGYFSGRGVGHYVYMSGNHFTAVNSPTQTTDSPTSNFATMTPIDGSPATFSDGNLKVTSDTSNSYRGGTSTIGLPPGSGKWYVEAKTNGGSLGGNKEYGFGAVTNKTDKAGGFFPGSYGGGTEFGYYSGSGGIIYNDPNSSVGSVGVYGSGTVDTVALRFDMDTSSPTCKFYVNNSLRHTSNLTTGTTYFPHFNIQDSSLAWTVNFGATDFTYTLPTDHKAISAANMFTATSPTIGDGSAHHQSILWSGSSGAKVGTQAGNSGFEPDWAIIKDRDFGNIANSFDAVRGGTSGTLDNKGLAFDSGSEDDNNAGPAFGIATGKGTLTFTGAGDTGDINTSGRTYVGWTWLGGNGNTTPSPQGTRPTTCSVNQTGGFSIVSWEGNNTNEVTIAHGLGATPDMIIYRKREGSQWFVQHAGCTGGVDNGASTKQLIIDGDDAEGGPFSGGYIDTVGSSTVRLKKGTSSMNNCNANGDNYISYMFVGIPGYSAFGRFTGNGSSDGPFIECGFSPSFVMTKKISNSTGGDWYVVDSARDTANPADLELSWHRASTEDGDQGSDHLDFLSNGFKMRSSGAGSSNESNCTSIYMAFAKNPFASSTPGTAR